MMAFHYPVAFYLFLPFALLGGLTAWSRWRRIRDLGRIGDWRLIKQLLPVAALHRRRIKDALGLSGLFVLIFSAAGPQFGSRLKEVKQRGAEVFIAMDTSRSMLAEDVPPSRLDHAKRALGVLIDKLAGNRVGIIAFAKRAVIQCPLTVDNDAARMFLEILDDKTVPEQGTAIGDAIRLALESFPKDDKSGRAIVLLTDGEDHSSDPRGAAKIAKEAGVIVFTIGIGTSKGEVIKDRDEQGKVVSFHKYEGEMVLSRLDDGLLNEIAAITGGKYYRASSGDSEIDDIADMLNNFEKKEFALKTYERLQERYQFFLLVALLLLFLEFFFSENPGSWNRLRAFSRVSTVSAVVLFLPSVLRADFKDHVREGNRLLKNGDPAGARVEFESARVDLPEAAFLPYNIAATYYSEGKMEEAKKQYEQALAMTIDPGLRSKILYNTGHLLFNMGKRDEAVEKFKECLRLTPDDMDAKYNIEYIKAGKQPKTPPPQQQKQDDKNKGQGDKKEKGQAGQENQAKEEPEKKPGEISKEDAERVLQMMRDQESEKIKDARIPKPGLKKPKDDQKDGGGEDW